MSTVQRLADYDDKSFDPFTTFDAAGGLFEVEEPYTHYRELQSRGGVQAGDVRAAFGLAPFAFWADLPSYMVFGHANVQRVYSDGETFSNGIMQRLYADSFGESINGMDAPEHARYRRLFQKAFMPGTVAKWGSELVPKVVHRIIDEFAGRGHAELVREFTSRYPFDVVYGQLRLPDSDREAFHRLSVGLMCITVDYPHALEASRKMGDYFRILLAERRRKPLGDDDLVSLLATAEIDGHRLPEEITISFLRQLMNAAGDTTYRSTGSLLCGLLNHPEQLAAIRADRSLIPQAVEEGLRWDGPLTVLFRQAMRDVEVGGVTIPAGAKVDVVAGTANRDPLRYTNPDAFDIHRKADRHMAFAFGPHICIGQHLARLEMSRAIDALLDRLPGLRVDPDYPPPKIVGLNSRAPVALHVRFDSAAKH